MQCTCLKHGLLECKVKAYITFVAVVRAQFLPYGGSVLMPKQCIVLSCDFVSVSVNFGMNFR